MTLCLIAMAGLPGAGKSSIAEGIAGRLSLPVISVDPIEAAMWRAGLSPNDTGIAAYRVAEAIAEENLRRGLSVVVDAVNPVDEAREMWRHLAERASAMLTFVECVCSDEGLHRARIELRVRNIEGMPEVTWDRVVARRAVYEPWSDDRIVIDTAVVDSREATERVFATLLPNFAVNPTIDG